MEAWILRGGIVCDGTARPPARADILVKEGRIAAIAPHLPDTLPGFQADGCLVTPGFVDQHRHCDLAPFRDASFGRLELAQGITSTVVGNCGLSAAPLDPNQDHDFFAYMAPVLGPVPAGAPCASHAAYAAALAGRPLPLHIGFLAGLGSVRYAVKGFSPSPFTARELARGMQLVEEALDAGACGVSLGMMYRPECYTLPEEYAALLAPVARRGGVLCTHIRGEGDSLVASVQEVLKLAREAGVRLNISHFKATGVRNWRSSIFRAIDCLENARAGGQDVTADFYPYDGGSTTLLSLLPPSLADCPPEFFATAAGRTRLRRELYRDHPGWDNMVTAIGWERILLSAVTGPGYLADQGKDFCQIAATHGFDDPADLMADLLASEGGNAGIIVLSMDWADVQTVAKLPYTALISDALYGDAGSPHPRLYGAFPRMLRKLVQEDHCLTLEQAIAKMTALPARCLGLTGRGVLAPGACADLLVFRPEEFADHATYTAPKQFATGMRLVFVNGRLAFRHDTMEPARAGTLLRGPAYTQKG